MLQNTLPPSLSEKFDAIIWKIEADEENDIVAVETRNQATHKAYFSALNYSTGECYFKEQSTENSWWWGLDRVHSGMVFLHGYKTEGSPEHRGIIAWDAKSGKLCWQQFSYSLDGISDDGLIAHNSLIQAAKPELLSPETGSVLKRNIQNYTSIKRDTHFPSLYNPSMPLPSFIPDTVTGPVFKYTHKEKSCWSFHVKSSSGFIQKLVITEKGKVIVSENLTGDIQKLNPEAFFMHKNYLFCIRQNNYELVSFAL